MECRLGENPALEGAAVVKLANVAARGFKLDKDAWSNFPDRVIAMDAGSKQKYLDRITPITEKSREYVKTGNAMSDNMAVLEKLGLGVYTKKYVYVLDFSDCFELALSKLTGLSFHKLNKMISIEASRECKQALRGRGNLPLSYLAGLNADYTAYFAERAKRDGKLSEEQVMEDVYGVVNDVMGYVFMDYQQWLLEKFNVSIVLRSYTLSELIITTDMLLDAEARSVLVMYGDGVTKVDVKLQPKEIVVL